MKSQQRWVLYKYKSRELVILSKPFKTKELAEEARLKYPDGRRGKIGIGRLYLFAGSDRGGESAAAIYSLIGTAKLNGIDPESYLRNVLSRIPDHHINRIDELLPWNFLQESPQAPTAS